MNEIFYSFYEIFYGVDSFVDAFSFSELYGIIGIVTLAIALFTTVLFYFIINSTNFNKLAHWLIIMAVTFGIVFLFTFMYPQDIVMENDFEISNEQFITFGLINALIAIVYYFVFSVILKRWSVNGSVTPF